MGMLPMFSNMNIGQGMDKEGQVKMRKYMTMMDSMSEKELDETDARKLMDIDRMKRIAYGSGTSLVCCYVHLLSTRSGHSSAWKVRPNWNSDIPGLPLIALACLVVWSTCLAGEGGSSSLMTCVHAVCGACRWKWGRCSATSG